MTHRLTNYHDQVVLDTLSATLSDGAKKHLSYVEPKKTVETVDTLTDVKA